MKPPSLKNTPPEPDIPPFSNGDVVRRRYHSEQAGMIIGTVYRLGNVVSYLVNWPDEVDEHEHAGEELKLDSEYVEKAN